MLVFTETLREKINSHDNFHVKLQHTTLVGGPNPTCCPLCQKVCLSGEALMEHMKFVHKDPNASGVPGNPTFQFCSKHYFKEIISYKYLQFRNKTLLFSAKRRNANHPCPVCGKFYVNEGSLRKHLTCHPEMASQITQSLRMWPCTVCSAVFTHENGKSGKN